MREISRRTMLRQGMAATTAAFLSGCLSRASRIQTSPLARERRFARVLAAPDRVIRSVAGLRPFRPSGFVVRAESLGEKTVVHNYGHGGGGITLSWGSSALAADLAAETGQRSFAVLGCGVMGLTTARLLQDRGFEATIYSKDLPPNTTSNVAGGQWSPYTVSDADKTTPTYRQQFERASRLANRYYQNLVGPTYGVRWIENYILSDKPFSSQQNPIGDLYFASEVIAPGDLPFAAAYARRFTTMLIEPPVFLGAITRDFLLRGGRIRVRDFHDRSELQTLAEPVIINCTGLGSQALFGDSELVPIKGQLAVLLPQPEVDYILIQGDYYMFPRSDGIILGGTHDRGEWSLAVDPLVTTRIVEGHRSIFSTMRGSG